MAHFIPIWKQALTEDVLLQAKSAGIYTSRFTITSPVAGQAFKLRFHNRRGQTPYAVKGVVIKTDQNCQTVTMGGKKEFQIETGTVCYSDEVQLQICEDQAVEIRICFEGNVSDANRIESNAVLLKGNYLYGDIPDKKQSWLSKKMNLYAPVPMIDCVELNTESSPELIVAFGDSITALSQWTKPLADRLQSRFPGKYILLNAGISGNCLLYERPGKMGKFFGSRGIDRFAGDVLDLPGLKTVIFALGVNDVSYYNKKTQDQINLKNYSDAVVQIADMLKERDVRLVLQTITPRVGVSPLMGIYTREMEEQRKIFNEWIKEAAAADIVFDAEKVLGCQTKKGLQIKDGWHAGDHLHPNALGGKKLAEAYDLEELAGVKTIPAG